jgi:hypothetical protein
VDAPGPGVYVNPAPFKAARRPGTSASVSLTRRPESAVEQSGDIGHECPIHEERRASRRPGRRKPRRWVVERTFSWLSKCRALLAQVQRELNCLPG